MAKVTIDELVTKYVFEVDPAGVRRYQQELEKSGVSAKRAAAAAERYATDAARANMKSAERAAKAQEDAATRWAKANERAAERTKIAAERAAQKQIREAEKAARAQERAAKKSGGGADFDLAGSLQNLAAGAIAFESIKATAQAAIGAVVDLGRSVIETGMSFESLRARLKTVEGSTYDANKAFALIQDFAKRTPFEVEDITAAFTQLRVRGVKPTEESLTALGDLSSAFGYGFGEMTDAIGAAARGELDPIEKFGIAAKVAGDKIKLSFKGQTVEVGRSAEAVTNALVQFGKMEGVQGAMAEQSKTAAGMVSNLKDSISQFLDAIAQMGVLDAFKEIIAALNEQIGGNDGLARVIADFLLIGLEAFRDLLTGLPSGELIGFLQALVTSLGLIVDFVMDTNGVMGDLIPMLLSVMTTVLSVANSLAELFARLRAVKEQIPGLPGPLAILGAALKVTVELLKLFGEFVEYVIDLLDPFIVAVEKAAGAIDGFVSGVGEAADKAKDAIGGFLGLTDAVEESALGFDKLRDAIHGALEELGKWIKANETPDLSGKTNEELEELAKSDSAAGKAALEELTRRRGLRGENAGKARAARDQERRQQLDAMIGPDITLTDADTLTRIAGDPSMPQEYRDKADKELSRRSKRDGKKGGKKGKGRELTGLEKQVEGQFKELANAAEVRVSAQALEQGKSPSEAFALGKEAAKQTEERLRTRFAETGELPIGISRDISQLARAPSVEESIGRVPPPVISVVNNVTNVTVSGNEFSTEVDAQLQGVTANELSREVSAATMKMVKTELGAAIQNVLPKVRV